MVLQCLGATQNNGGVTVDVTRELLSHSTESTLSHRVLWYLHIVVLAHCELYNIVVFVHCVICTLWYLHNVAFAHCELYNIVVFVHCVICTLWHLHILNYTKS
jgi:hypothetical protein